MSSNGDEATTPDRQQPRTGGVEPVVSGGVVSFGESAVEMRQDLSAQRTEATRDLARIEAEVADAKAELERRRKAMELDFQRQRAELEAKMAPLVQQLAEIKELAHTVDLYLGRDEQLTLLRDGAPAGVDEPITLRQMVLAMDEESLALVEAGGVDATRKDAFIDWLVADDSHLDRVIPDRKGVVVLVPTRQQRDYGDTFRQKYMDEVNRQSHWLIRNGQRVYQLIADIQVGSRLLPKRSEFVDFFYTNRYDVTTHQTVRVPLEPGSKRWLDAEDAADAKRRHYMKIMLVLQGLADRTVAFHPLPEGGVNFLSLDSQDQGKVRIVNELDNVLTSGREPFRDWQRRLNAQLRPGMRIIGNFGQQFNAANNYYDRNDRPDMWRHSRIRPNGASHPVSNEIYLIEDRAARDGLVIRYHRRDTVYRGGYGEVSGTAKVRASCTVYPDDSFILPFDLVSVAELTAYLDARTERHQYLGMVPVLRAALAAKRDEEAQEEPFRLLLTGAILAAYPDIDQTEVEAAVPALVQHYKLANRWARPLVLPDPAEQGKAVDAVVREFTARRAAAGTNAVKDAAALAAARALPGVIAVGRRRDGTYTAYAPSAPHQNVWLDEYRLTGKGKVSDTRRWTIPPGRSLAALTMLHTEPAWDSWNLRASRSEHIAGPEASAYAEQYLFPAAPGPAIALTHKFGEADGATGWFHLYCWATPDGSNTPDATDGQQPVFAMLTELVARWKRDARGNIVPVPYDGHYQYRNNQREWVPPQNTRVRDSVQFTWSGSVGDAYNTPDTDSRAGSSARDSLAVPGIPPENLTAYREQHGREPSSEVLVWLDNTQWNDVRRAHATHVARRSEQRAAQQEADREAYRYVDAILDIIRAEIEDAAKARFFEDYGPDAADLWPGHLKSLDLRDPVHPRTLWGIIAIAMKHGHPVVEQTLDALAEYAWTEHHNQAPGEWHPDHGKQNLEGYGHITVPELSPAELDDPDARRTPIPFT